MYLQSIIQKINKLMQIEKIDNNIIYYITKMDKFITSDIIKYIISDYVAYPYILYTHNLKLNAHRKNITITTDESYKTITEYIDDKMINYSNTKNEYEKICTTTVLGTIMSVTKSKSKYNEICDISKYKNNLEHGWSITNAINQNDNAVAKKIKKYYIKGILNGPYIEYWNNKIYMYTYTNNIMDGPCRYYDDGILIVKGYRKLYKYIGKIEYYNHDGTIEKIENYDKDGNLNGSQLYYNKGKLCDFEFYDTNGYKMVDVSKYDRFGKTIKTGVNEIFEKIKELYEIN
jgi:antitoxin component YwqK of YwqJK toxin-antitoxin module